MGICHLGNQKEKDFSCYNIIGPENKDSDIFKAYRLMLMGKRIMIPFYIYSCVCVTQMTRWPGMASEV